jgi:hypothetical protein
MVVIAQRIVQGVALQEELENRLGELRPFRDSARLAIEPAQILRTTHSTGITASPATSDSRSFSRTRSASGFRQPRACHHERVDLVVGLAFLLSLASFAANRTPTRRRGNA